MMSEWKIHGIMFRGVLLVVIVTCVSLSAARRSPQADNIEKFLISQRYSNDVFEDALLDAPGLIKKYRYPVEVHNVTTEDGYILEMHRIPHGRDANNVPNQRKPVVFLMHGMLVSSADFVIMGPGTSLAYILAEEGFDVWMGNARGNYYSRNHVSLQPGTASRNPFWKFSWHEIGNKDLPAMIDHALKVSGEQRLHYVGHSQGSTSFFVLASTRPEYNAKIISMHAFAPVAYMGNTESPLLRFFASHANSIESIAHIVGVGEFLPSNSITKWVGLNLCQDGAIIQPWCSNVIFLLAGWNENQHNATMLPVIMGHAPAGISVRQLSHYGQSITNGGFRRYDHGSRLANFREYGVVSPPDYDMSRITAPVFLHYSDSDPLAHVDDVEILFKKLTKVIKYKVPMTTFSHVDFTYGINAKDLVYNTVITIMKVIDVSAF